MNEIHGNKWNCMKFSVSSQYVFGQIEQWEIFKLSIIILTVGI